MLVTPLPWLSPFTGGYLQQKFPMVRIGKSEEQYEYIDAASKGNHLSTIMRCLDVLGSTAWKINSKIFKVAAHYWNSGEECPKIPPKLNNLPEIKKPENIANNPKEYYAYKEACQERTKLLNNAFSGRCSANYKLDIAQTVFNY